MRYSVWGIFSLWLFGALLWLWPLELSSPNTTLYFYDVSGELLYEQGPAPVITEVPDFLGTAIVALEDRKFYQHQGVNWGSIIRASRQNLKSDRVVSGASTISMQLARLEFMPTVKRNWWYKIKQIFYALKLEQRYTKSDILRHYLSRVPLGNGSVGFADASNRYFSKSLTQLSEAELVSLLAIVQNPSRFNPLQNPDKASERRELMWRRLVDSRVVTTEEKAAWEKEIMVLKPTFEHAITAPHFVFWVRERLPESLFNEPELHIFTTLNKSLYEDSLAILNTVIADNQQEKQINNGSVVVLGNNNQIKVMVGSPNFFDDTIDGAVNLAVAPRQAGSVLKPFLFALALEQGFSPADSLTDLKTIFPDGYWPRNFNVEEENGTVRFREALANSYNIATIDLLNRVGTDSFYFFLETLGFDFNQSSDDFGLSLGLGSGNVGLLSLTRAYSIFTHQGNLYPVKFIDRIENGARLKLYQPEERVSQKVLSSNSAEWTQHVLSDDVARWKNFSRGNSLELPFASGAKTGTSQGFEDNWVVGFSPSNTVGVWAGNADGRPMVASSGMQGAGPLWQRIMQRVHADQASQRFVYQGERQVHYICRRPQATECVERVTAFLTPAEKRQLATAEARVKNTFEIVYPAEGSVLVTGSDLLIQYRGQAEAPIEYWLNNQSFKGPIYHNLPKGSHQIKLQTLDGAVDMIQIQVEDLNP